MNAMVKGEGHRGHTCTQNIVELTVQSTKHTNQAHSNRAHSTKYKAHTRVVQTQQSLMLASMDDV